MEAPTTLELLRIHLQQPEYLHTLLNPVPIYGMAMGVLALLLAMALRSRRAQITALVLVFISAAMAWPVTKLGDKAYDGIESRADHDRAHWLDAHAQRATRFLWVFYATAAVAAIALVVPWKFPKTALSLNLLTLLAALGALTVGGWIAFAGGQAMHKEFRAGGAVPAEPLGGYDDMRN